MESNERLMADAQSIYDSAFENVIELGYQREVAIAVAMAASTRLIEVMED